MKRLTWIFLLLLVSVLAACDSAPAEPIVVDAQVVAVTYEVTNDSKDVVAVVTWDGTEWTCSETNCTQNRAIDGNTMHFFLGMNRIAVENLEVPGQLVAEPGYTVWFVGK